MRLGNGHKITAFAGNQSFESRYLVKEKAVGDLPPFFAPGKVFGQHDLVVPEVEVGFFRVAAGQGAAADVVNHRLRTAKNLVAGKLDPPAKINLFLVGKKVFVEAMQLVKDHATDDHGRTGGPE